MLRGLRHHLLDHLNGQSEMLVGQSRMDQKHQACFSQLFSEGQALMFSSTYKSFFQINLAATADETRHTLPCDGSQDLVAVPSRLQHFVAHEGVVLVISMLRARWRYRYPQSGQ